MKGWLLGLGRNAVKKVRRQYGIPDPERQEYSDASIRRYDLSLEAIGMSENPDGDEDNWIEPKLHPDWIREYAIEDAGNSTANLVLEEAQGQWILAEATASASPDVGQALMMLAMEDLSLN